MAFPVAVNAGVGNGLRWVGVEARDEFAEGFNQPS